MKKLKHKNVVTLHEVIDDPESDNLYMSYLIFFKFKFKKKNKVMDYAERGELLKLCEEEGKFAFTQEHPQDFLSEGYLKKIFLDILEGLSYRIFYILTHYF